MRDGNEIVFGVAILAAGSSRRMGRPKLLLPWGDTTVLGHLIQQWRDLGAAQTAIVCAAEANPLKEELRRLAFPGENQIINPAPERGMFSSIQCVVDWPGWKPELTHIAITLGDQPHLQDATLRELVSFASVNPARICQPLRNGRRRHPVLLPKTIFAELVRTSAGDLKSFLEIRVGELAGFSSDDSGLDLDMDTPEDYERLQRLCFGEARIVEK